MKSSLKRFLLLSLLSGITCWWGVVTLWLYWEADHEVAEIYDANLVQTARVLMRISEDAHDAAVHTDVDLYAAGGGHEYESKLMFVMATFEGEVLLQSRAAPELPLPRAAGFRDLTLDGFQWRVFTLLDPEHRILVQTGERRDVRREMMWEIVEAVLNPLLYALPVLALLIWLSVRHGLKPLQKLSGEIAARAPEQLHPVTSDNVPREILPVIQALNRLFANVAQAFANERRFTADAAHELRTPLAGIKLQAELAQRDPGQHQQALARIQTGVDRATHLVGQLLALARMDAQHSLAMETVDLAPLVARAIQEHWPQIVAKQIEVTLEAPDDLPAVRANPDALAVLVRNLLDNAVRYTPPAGTVQITLSRHADGVQLIVADSGPGIAAGEREALFERFRRGKHPDVSGSGLGLSIVRRVAELHQASLHLETGLEGRGLTVVVGFILP